MSKQLIDISGEQFTRLTAIAPTEKRDGTFVVWLCRCICVNLTEVRGRHLRTGRTKSCGCLRRQNNKSWQKHGESRTRLYNIWKIMVQRCFNSNRENYRYYGGKGVTVCSEWLNNYPAFRNWALDNGYADNLTIDRIDNDGNYVSDNCQWITRAENSRKSHHDNLGF